MLEEDGRATPIRAPDGLRRSRRPALGAPGRGDGDPRRPSLHGQNRHRPQSSPSRSPSGRDPVGARNPTPSPSPWVCSRSRWPGGRSPSVSQRTLGCRRRQTPLGQGLRPRVGTPPARLGRAGRGPPLHRRHARHDRPELRAKARRMKLRYGIRAIVIDYLQLLTSPTQARESRQVEVSEISRSIKSIARELRDPRPVPRAAQPRRREPRGQPPRMSDLRESGSIEQDADVVMLLHREAYYHRGDPAWDPQSPEFDEDNRDKLNMTELIIAKQRNGPTGLVKLVWDASTVRFKNHDPYARAGPVRIRTARSSRRPSPTFAPPNAGDGPGFVTATTGALPRDVPNSPLRARQEIRTRVRLPRRIGQRRGLRRRRSADGVPFEPRNHRSRCQPADRDSRLALGADVPDLVAHIRAMDHPGDQEAGR